MITLKEKIRNICKKSTLFDKIWNIVWWIDVKRRMVLYSDFEFCQKLWRKCCGKEANLSNPQTFNEKMWLLKLSNRDPLITQCSDKHAAREYIKKCGFPEILKKEYGFYKNTDEIDFSTLPSPCYLKCNHGSGLNFIYRKEDKNDLRHIKWKFDFLMKQNPYYLSREWNYKNIVPGIVCEEVLEMPNGQDIPELQFFCFNGEPKLIMYNVGLADEKGNHKLATRWVFDMNYQLIQVKTSQPTTNNPPEKPANFDKMVEIATVLGRPFPHVRVDLFNINGKIYFNELTFSSGGGFVKLEPDEWQRILGDWLDVSEYQISPDAYKKHKWKEL